MILKHICQIIKDYMDLPDGKVWIKDEKLNLPIDNTFTIAVGFMNVKSIGSSARISGPNETIATNMSGQVSIDIMGRTFDVVTRKEEIIQAMKCTACKESQIKNGFMIGEAPTSVNDISAVDGSAIPYRFQFTFGVQFFITKTKIIDYYDNFTKEVLYVST